MIAKAYYCVTILLVFVTTAFAVPPPSAGSILSEERQAQAHDKIQEMQTTPPEEEIETSQGSEVKSEDKIAELKTSDGNAKSAYDSKTVSGCSQ